MKNIIVIVIIGFLLSKAYESYEKKHLQIPNNLSSTGYDISESSSNDAPMSARFKCDGRTHCSQMTSCEEAVFFLQNCLNVEMDGNHDGEPCEKQWCN
jgi:Excalibur calcium-binding domain